MARKKSAAKKAREALEASNPSAAAAAAANTAVPKKAAEESRAKQAKKAAPPSEDEESDDDSESEDEDEYGELITEGIEHGINEVLNAIKTNPSKLLDPSVKFFDAPEPAASGSAAAGAGKKDKPIYLKDYHRMNLLSGSYKDDDDEEEAEGNEYGTVDGEKPFVVTEREERARLISDINSAFNGGSDGANGADDGEGAGDDSDSDSDDGFLKKKQTVHPSRREIIDSSSALPDPNADENEFLSAFVDKKAWIPKDTDKVINLDRIDNEDDTQFDEAVEQFEHAYNFRYEDPNAAEIVSYARNQATLRRSATNARKRQREKEHELREQEDRERQEQLKKKKTSKVNEVADRLKKIKEAVGDEVPDDVIARVFGDALLKDDFDDTDWDSKMAQIFDEQYYEAGDAKPQFSDDDDDELEGEAEELDGEEDEDDNEHSDEEDASAAPAAAAAGSSKKDKLKEKKSAKKEKEAIKEKAQEIVEANALKLLSEVVEERGRSRAKASGEDVKFKYREVSPETFGLTTRDIILADDKQLNNYIGLKKFSPYRPKELRMKDKRKYAKAKQLKEWRKETFGKGGRRGPAEAKDADDTEVWIPVEGEVADHATVAEAKGKDKKHKKSKSKSKSRSKK